VDPGATFTVTADVQLGTAASVLVGVWIDFSRNGGFDGPPEAIIAGPFTSSGPKPIVITAPIGSKYVPGVTGMRVRISTELDIDANGRRPDGEVEDYALTLTDNYGYDFGDAPASYDL